MLTVLAKPYLDVVQKEVVRIIKSKYLSAWSRRPACCIPFHVGIIIRFNKHHLLSIISLSMKCNVVFYQKKTQSVHSSWMKQDVN